VRVSSIITPPRQKVRTIEDLAPLHRETRGLKLRGTRWNRSTPVVIRRIDPKVIQISREKSIKNTYDSDGLGPYSETRGKLFA
jgi:hypothetical protein